MSAKKMLKITHFLFKININQNERKPNQPRPTLFNHKTPEILYKIEEHANCLKKA